MRETVAALRMKKRSCLLDFPEGLVDEVVVLLLLLLLLLESAAGSLRSSPQDPLGSASGSPLSPRSLKTFVQPMLLIPVSVVTKGQLRSVSKGPPETCRL